LEFTLTDGTTDTVRTLCDQALVEVCEWLANKVGESELKNLVLSSDWEETEAVAYDLYQWHSNWPGLIELLDQMAHCRSAIQEDVRRSTLRDALWFLVKASQQYPNLPLREQLVRTLDGIAGHKRHASAPSTTAATQPPSSMPIFQVPEPVLTV